MMYWHWWCVEQTWWNSRRCFHTDDVENKPDGVTDDVFTLMMCSHWWCKEQTWWNNRRCFHTDDVENKPDGIADNVFTLMMWRTNLDGVFSWRGEQTSVNNRRRFCFDLENQPRGVIDDVFCFDPENQPGGVIDHVSTPNRVITAGLNVKEWKLEYRPLCAGEN